MESYHAALKRQMLVSHPNIFFSSQFILMIRPTASGYVKQFRRIVLCCFILQQLQSMSVIFLSCIFHPLVFLCPSFTCPTFSVNSYRVDSICAKASSRLFFLIMSKRCSISIDDLLYFYTLLFGQYWNVRVHRGTIALQKTNPDKLNILQAIQKRALKIIFNSNCTDCKKFASFITSLK